MKISLRDPLWQFIAVIVAIAIPIIIYYSQRQYKELSYEIISSSPLLAKSKEIEGNVQIFFDNKPVSNVYLVILKLINSGNTPISAKDYESPIAFNFGGNTNILSADVSKAEPESLKINLDKIKNKVILEPLLLNAGDTIIFKFILSDYSGDIKPEARIYGIKDISFKRKGGFIWIYFFTGALGAFLACVLITVLLFYAKVLVYVKNRTKIE